MALRVYHPEPLTRTWAWIIGAIRRLDKTRRADQPSLELQRVEGEDFWSR